MGGCCVEQCCTVTPPLFCPSQFVVEKPRNNLIVRLWLHDKNITRFSPKSDLTEYIFPWWINSGDALYPLKILPCNNSDLFWHTSASVVCGLVNPKTFLRRGVILLWFFLSTFPDSNGQLVKRLSERSWQNKRHINGQMMQCLSVCHKLTVYYVWFLWPGNFTTQISPDPKLIKTFYEGVAMWKPEHQWGNQQSNVLYSPGGNLDIR